MSSKFLILAISISAGFNSLAAESDSPEATLEVNGHQYANSCLPKPLAKLKKTIESSQRQGFPAALAWPLINKLICAKGIDADVKFVIQNMASRVSVEESAPTGGTEKAKLVAPSNDFAEQLLAKGSAWNSTVGIQKNTIRVNYLSDGTCSKSFTLKLISNQWKISNTYEICD
jgi:hypothetical protein